MVTSPGRSVGSRRLVGSIAGHGKGNRWSKAVGEAMLLHDPVVPQKHFFRNVWRYEFAGGARFSTPNNCRIRTSTSC